MKENIYDSPAFFSAYKDFPRSVEGLSAAGEWEEFQKLLPPLQNQRVLDLGCGFGWHCMYAASKGAAYVLGTDISEKMLEVAKEKNTYSQVAFQQIAIEDIDTRENFNLVISSLALHYVPSFESVAKKVYDLLSPKGNFVFSVEHPIFTAQGPQNWYYDSNGSKLHWPVDSYFSEGKRTATFLGEKVEKYHKTLTTYINTLIAAGFRITAVIEPTPSEQHLKDIPEMKDELRRPMMLLVSATK